LELLKETLKKLNEHREKPITRGQLVAAISEELVSVELRGFLKTVGTAQL
jgi:hypothetical protein